MSNEYLDIAMKKVIRQEVNMVLDKIRAEIMAIGNWTTKGELPNGYLVKVLEIIDKYKAESEDHDEIKRE